MINDYNALLGWKFEKIDRHNQDNFFIVTTMIQIEV